jgi:VanZ family protein
MRPAARSRALRWAAVALWASAIFAASSLPGSQLPGGFSTQAHFIEYAVLGALAYHALRLDRGSRQAALIAVAIASAYGASDEFHQVFVAMRTPDVVDWLVDTAGAAFGAGVAYALERWRAGRAQ